MADTSKKYMTADEKVYLTEFVEKYKTIIECKKTDCVSVSQKKKTWEYISKEFNAISQNTSRTPKQLTKAWENIKTRRKKELSAEKKERMATGGGVYKPKKDDDDIDGLLNCVDIELKDSIDSDTIVISTAVPGEYVVDPNNILCKQEKQGACLLSYTPIRIGITDGTNGPHGGIEDLEGAASTSTSTAAVSERGEKKKCTSNEPTPKSKYKKSSYTSRGTAVERELEVRLLRNQLLREQEEEIHALRLQEHQLRVEEQRLKVAEQQPKTKIAELQLSREMLLTEQAKNNNYK